MRVVAIAILLCLAGIVTTIYVAAIGMSIGYISAPSRTLTFTGYNCSCKIPCIWIIKKQQRFLLEANRLFGGTFILDAKYDPFSWNVGSASYANSIRQRLESLGYRFTEEDYDAFQGQHAYSYSICKEVGGHMVYTHQTWFALKGTRYLIAISERDSDPMKDAQLKAAMDSFTLLDSSFPSK
jgi:hypothetical protein